MEAHQHRVGLRRERLIDRRTAGPVGWHASPDIDKGRTMLGGMVGTTAGTVYLIAGILLGVGLLVYALYFFFFKLGK
jgi:hypothetical protein